MADRAKCENCGRVITRKHERGEPRKYCNGSCRMKAYRKRQDELTKLVDRLALATTPAERLACHRAARKLVGEDD